MNKIIIFRWGATSDRTPADGSAITNTGAAGPYVRRRSAAGVNETSVNSTVTTSPSTTTSVSMSTPTITSSSTATTAYSSLPSTLVSVTTSLPSGTTPPTATTNVTVTSSNDDSIGGKRRSNVPPSRDEEAEAQRKHRSAQARRERRSTQSVTQDDIKAAEQQIKNRPNNTEISSTPSLTSSSTSNNTVDSATVTLSNNKIGAPSTPSTVAEHDIETERLQRLIEEKKDKARRTSGGNEVRDLLSRTHLIPSDLFVYFVHVRFFLIRCLFTFFDG